MLQKTLHRVHMKNISIYVDSTYICIISTCCKKSNIFFRIVKEFCYQILEKGTKVINSSMHVTCAKK